MIIMYFHTFFSSVLRFAGKGEGKGIVWVRFDVDQRDEKDKL